MIARTELVIDCPDPKALARFYADLLGGVANVSASGDWASVDHSGAHLSFQAVSDFRAPTWPSQERGQQFHLDFFVDDFGREGARAVELGASLVETNIRDDGTGFVVYLDPAGHPFCLCREHPDNALTDIEGAAA